MDFNGDGCRDLLAAGYAGFGYLFLGRKDGTFQASVILADKTGQDIHMGRFYDFKENTYKSVSKDPNTDKIDFIRAFDWDNDGDLDLLMSGSKGIKLRVNEGTRTKPVYAAENLVVIAANTHAADAIVDWDGDGLWDIISGSRQGGAYFYKNTGKPGAPSFGKAECILESAALIPDGKGELRPIANIGSRLQQRREARSYHRFQHHH